MFSSGRRNRQAVNVWPGYVDALSALLMVVIFVLLIFSLAQFFLARIVDSQDNELTNLSTRLAELTALLNSEQTDNESLRSDILELSGMLNEMTAKAKALQQTVSADKDTIKVQLSTLASLQEDIDALRKLRAQLEGEIGSLTQANTQLRDRSKALDAKLLEANDRTHLQQKDISEKKIRIQQLAALIAANEQALSNEKELSNEARVQMAILNQQIEALRKQLEEIATVLEAAELKESGADIDAKDIGHRLNILLAKEVNRLRRYQSEFFGRLREALGDNPNVRVEGDRFLFQSELLFSSGSATLGQQGREQIRQLAVTLKEISSKIPPDLPWVLRIDGHTDKVPIKTAQFPSNWELSTARALSVVKYLAELGIASDRMAAAGFGQHHPLDDGDSPAAYRANRRIEIKLTNR